MSRWKNRNATAQENAKFQSAARAFLQDGDIRGLLRFGADYDFPRDHAYHVLADNLPTRSPRRTALSRFKGRLEGYSGVEFTLSHASERRQQYKKMTQKECLTLKDAREIARCQQLARKPWHRRLFGL